MTPITVQQQQEKEEYERNNRRSYTPPPSQPIHYNPVVDESSGPMIHPSPGLATDPGKGAPRASKADSPDAKTFILAGVVFVVAVIIATSHPVVGLVGGAIGMFLIWKSVRDKAAIKASISTGPEMDAILIEKYNKDLARYQRKLQSLRSQQMVARSGGINNAIFNVQPKPPQRPVLSTDRRP
jgi:hypothetical protein